MEAARNAPSAVSDIVVASICLALGITLAVKRKRVTDFFVEVNGGSERKRALNRTMFGIGIPLMALMFAAFGVIFEIYGVVKLI